MRLHTAPLPLAQLTPPQEKTKEIRDTVSSLRLDAVCSTGFRMARGKAVDMISSGHVQVNWRPCTKADKLLTEGDTVSARGFGKFQLAAVGGVTKKGRTAIVVKRYIVEEEGAACWNTSLKRYPAARSTGFTCGRPLLIGRSSSAGRRMAGDMWDASPKASAGLTALSRASTGIRGASGLRLTGGSETWSKADRPHQRAGPEGQDTGGPDGVGADGAGGIAAGVHRSVLGNLKSQLDHTYVVDDQGNKRKLKQKED